MGLEVALDPIYSPLTPTLKVLESWFVKVINLQARRCTNLQLVDIYIYEEQAKATLNLDNPLVVTEDAPTISLQEIAILLHLSDNLWRDIDILTQESRILNTLKLDKLQSVVDHSNQVNADGMLRTLFVAVCKLRIDVESR